MARIANFKIDAEVSALAPFENYNGTINAFHSGGKYVVWHWNTLILEYNLETEKIDFLSNYSSQTTRTLVGRLLRNLPRQAVLNYIATAPRYEQRSLRRMVRI